ncbi:MAG: hypothetical protein ACOC5G_03630 [Acidobacteriota bacterium]
MINRFTASADSLINFRKIWFFIGIVSLFTTFWIGKAGLLFIFLSGTFIVLLEVLFEFRKHTLPNFYFMMLFSPLLLLYYSTIGDFKIRMLCFLALIAIFNAAGARVPETKRIQFPPLKPGLVWAAAFVIFSTASIVLFIQGVHLSGDEPHYLMMTQSLVEDGDLNLENNIKNKTYYRYLPTDIQFHGKVHNKRYVSYHMPGVSFLLLPFYALFNLLGGLVAPALYFRLAASLINAFFALALYTVLKIEFPGKRITGIWLLFLCLFPLIIHSAHLYPELPAATLMMAAYVFAFGKSKSYWLSGLLLSLVAWFHVKYYPPLIILAIFIIIQIIKEKNFKQIFQFFLFPFLNFILLMAFCKTFYGSFNPADIFPSPNSFAAPIMLRVKIFLAYFLDQRDGLLFYSPLFFLLLFGFKKRLKNHAILLWIGFSYIVFHAFTTVRGAYSPAGRPLMFVSWIFIILIVNFYFEYRKNQFKYGFKWLAGLSFFVLFWLFYHPFFFYQPVFSQTTQRASDLLVFLGSSVIKLWTLFPSFLTRPETGHPTNFIWIMALFLFSFFYYLRKFKFNPFQKHQKLTGFCFFAILSYLFCLYPHVHLIPENQYISNHMRFFNNSKNFRFVESRNEFNILAGQTYKIFFESSPNQKHITLAFGNTDHVDVEIYNKTKLLFRSKDQKNQQLSMKLSSLSSLKIKKKTVIPLEIRTRTRRKKAFFSMKII